MCIFYVHSVYTKNIVINYLIRTYIMKQSTTSKVLKKKEFRNESSYFRCLYYK